MAQWMPVLPCFKETSDLIEIPVIRKVLITVEVLVAEVLVMVEFLVAVEILAREQVSSYYQ